MYFDSDLIEVLFLVVQLTTTISQIPQDAENTWQNYQAENLNSHQQKE